MAAIGIALTCKYHGSTDTKGSRYSASHEGRRTSIPFDHAKSGEYRQWVGSLKE